MAAIFFLEFESSIMYFIVFNRLIQNLCAIADLIVNKIHNNQIDIYSKSVEFHCQSVKISWFNS